MTEKRATLMLTLPGNNRRFAPDAILADLAKKLRSCDLASGTHEISIFSDGSVAVDNVVQWKPRVLQMDNTQKKAG